MQNRIGLFLALCGLLALWSSTATAQQRPNILIMMADDQAWNDSACYGNVDVATPNIDRLAEQGMRFTRAFTATAMCSPTRQQLYTGIFPVRNGAYPNHSQVKKGTKSLVHHFQALGYRVGLAGKSHVGPADSFPFEKVGKPGHLDFQAMAEFINREKQQPYVLLVTSHSPHLPWSEGDASVYDPLKLTLPVHLVDTPQTRNILANYYAEVTDFDREVGECMKIVQQSGAQDNTIFIYTSEQGSPFPRGKWTCYDTGLQVALVVRWPAKVKARSAANAMVQYVDVVPTLIEAAGGEPIKGLDGKSFYPVLLGTTDSHNRYVYGVHTTRGIIAGSECYPIRSIRSERYKLIWNLNYQQPFENITTSGRDRGMFWQSWVDRAATDSAAAKLVKGYQTREEFELYNVLSDPVEMNNLANDPATQSVRDDLHAKLKAWMLQQGDLGIETELAALDRQKNRGKKKPQKKKTP